MRRSLTAGRFETWWHEYALSNVISLYGAHVVTYAIPLLTIPYLVRILGASSWGLVAMAQGLGNYLNLVVEYGFSMSATRELAIHRQSPEHVAELLSGVTGAKILLTAGGAALAFLLQYTVPILQAHRAILWSGVIAGMALGLNPMWYFQGKERMQIVASLDVASRTAAAAGVFVFVHRPSDAWRVLALQAAASLVSTTVGLAMAYREVRRVRMNPNSIIKALRTGWTMFLFRSSAMLYTSGNSFLLGLFAPPIVVGYFAGAEKIAKAFMGMFNPFNQALYPRLNRLLHERPDRAARLFRANAVVVGVGGVVLGAAVFLAAPMLVRILLGHELAPAVPVLRLLSVLPLLIGLNTVLCTQWMAPRGLDATINWIIAGAGVVNIVLACIFAPRFQAMGMASAVIVAESWVFLASLFVLYRQSTAKLELSALALPDLENPA